MSFPECSGHVFTRLTIQIEFPFKNEADALELDEVGSGRFHSVHSLSRV